MGCDHLQFRRAISSDIDVVIAAYLQPVENSAVCLSPCSPISSSIDPSKAAFSSNQFTNKELVKDYPASSGYQCGYPSVSIRQGCQ